jgi:7-carboxy-7-deazaguanine synthase
MSSQLFNIAEIFDSINGEGLNAGKLATFVRLMGCNLNCTYCDTRWAIPKDKKNIQMDAQQIKKRILESGLSFVTLTGGEPLIAKHYMSLLLTLVSDKYTIDIETNGSVSIDQIVNDNQLKTINLIMDYKLPSSGMTNQMNLKNLQKIRKQDSLKFVIGSLNDMEVARKLIEEYELIGRTNLFFSPVFGSIEPETMVDFMKEHKLNGVTLQLQLHKIIWHPDAKGV